LQNSSGEIGGHNKKKYGRVLICLTKKKGRKKKVEEGFQKGGRGQEEGKKKFKGENGSTGIRAYSKKEGPDNHKASWGRETQRVNDQESPKEKGRP